MSKQNTIKVCCVFLFSVGLSAIIVSGNWDSNRAFAFAEGPPAGVNGDPGDPTCVICHNTAAVNSGEGSITIGGIPSAGYVPGQTYNMFVQDTTTDQSRKRWGFELDALVAKKNDSTGTLTITDGGNTQLTSGGGANPKRVYVEQTLQGTFEGQTGGAKWTFNWTAPSTNVGEITFYCASNFSAGCGTDQCGEIHTTKLTVNAQASEGPPPPPPAILNAAINGKALSIMGTGFDSKCEILINGTAVKTTFDSSTPTILTSPKEGKKLPAGTAVMLEVKDKTTGEISASFSFTPTD
ncbi:MAG TPA: choice-of-anchor V domain-containing protein [Blastocatellia bacterium]